ncbi:MAG TPA: ABC transporter permease [Planctomycetota bacterium]|jgi:peptide/nickel transport system permease protein|nr:ABC transporter permease [Planctomycetota bacterium]
MNEPTVYGKSYGDIVIHAFRKNRSARAALWISVAMTVLAALTPLLSNDRPFYFRGTMPGEYRKSFNQVSRGAMFQIIGLPGRLKEETGKFERKTATEADLLRRISGEEARVLYPAISRLQKRANEMPEIRGRWTSHDETLEEIVAEMTPDERPALDGAVQRIIRDLPSIYADLLRAAVTGVVLKLREMADQLEPEAAARSMAFEARFREALGPEFLTAQASRIPQIRAVSEELKVALDPDKARLVSRIRFPLLDSLSGLDLFFILSTLLGFVTFGPLSWITMRRISPIERRWFLSWILVLLPSLSASVLWEIAHNVKFQSVSYKKGTQDGTIEMTASLWPLIRYRYDEIPEIRGQADFPTPPDRLHPFGTDFMGRDLLSRMLWGSRISLSIGFVSTAIAIFIGVVLGALAGYYRGFVDIALSRLIEIMICFPSFFIILAVVAFLPPSIFYVMLVLGLFGWMGIARLQRGEFFRLMGQDFVVAGRALGATNNRIMFRHVLPNGMAPILVSASFGIASAMLTESGLSFLGFGVQEPATSWGQILYTGRTQLQHWWTFVIPGAAIFIAVTCYNLVGDGLRDAVDPRLKT